MAIGNAFLNQIASGTNGGSMETGTITLNYTANGYGTVLNFPKKPVAFAAYATNPARLAFVYNINDQMAERCFMTNVAVYLMGVPTYGSDTQKATVEKNIKLESDGTVLLNAYNNNFVGEFTYFAIFD